MMYIKGSGGKLIINFKIAMMSNRLQFSQQMTTVITKIRKSHYHNPRVFLVKIANATELSLEKRITTAFQEIIRGSVP